MTITALITHELFASARCYSELGFFMDGTK